MKTSWKLGAVLTAVCFLSTAALATGTPQNMANKAQKTTMKHCKKAKKCWKNKKGQIKCKKYKRHYKK